MPAEGVQRDGLVFLLEGEASGHEGHDRLLPGALDRTETETNGIVLDGELPAGPGDVRQSDLDARTPSVVEQFLDLVRVAHLAREVRRRGRRCDDVAFR